jgi:MFS family permease
MPTRRDAVRLVIALGLVSLLADATYEGARSIAGPFLLHLGANAPVVAIISGAGELISYTLRLASGRLVDRTRAYWLMTLIGYGVNLLAVPLLAWAGSWQWAAALLMIERAGKSFRTPARDVMLSQAAGRVGTGWGFGLHGAMDSIGAVAGPVMVSIAVARTQGFADAFLLLAIPAVLAMITLFTARWLYPKPEEFALPEVHKQELPAAFWVYVVAAGLVAAGTADFPLIAFHFEKTGLWTAQSIPLLYALAMGCDAIAALTFGRLFDRFGLVLIPVAVIACAIASPLAFLGDARMAALGAAFWGFGLGGLNNMLRAGIAGMVSMNKRGSAYGIFNGTYGLMWFAGSAAIGFLYERSIVAVVGFSLVAQALAIVMFVWFRQRTAR